MANSGNIITAPVRTVADVLSVLGIKPLTPRGTLKPVTYEKDGKKGIGFIAQDV